MSTIKAPLTLAALLLGAATMSATAGYPAEWLVVTGIPTTVEAREAIGRMGGTVVRDYPDVGTLLVSASDANFAGAARAIPGVSAVLPNVPLPVQLDAAAGEGGGSQFPPAEDELYPLQWGLEAIRVKGAWDAGYRGAGVRVAVLDTDFDLTHPGLAPNIRVDLAKSFVPGEPVTPPTDAETSHGTSVAGVIAAAADGVGTVGVAPDAELVPVRVVGGEISVALGAFLDGVAYAVAVEADVVNMSFIYLLPKAGGCVPGLCLTPRDVRATATVVGRAVKHARRHGVTMIAAAGNNALELNRRDELLALPAETKGVLAISATGPIGWALDPSTDLDVPTTYTNFGERVIYLSAPGGQIVLPPELECDLGFGLGPLPCQRFDWVFNTSLFSAARPSYYRPGAGTSFAAPHVAGVAALVIGKHGGSMSPGQVQAVLRRSADDLGEPGRDAYHGWGRVNAERAVEMTR